MKKLLLGLLGLLVPITIVGMLLPTDYSIACRVTIEATPAQVHALDGDLKRWEEWAPWPEGDPTIVAGHMGLLMDDWTSSDFDKGLAMLKEKAGAGG